MLRFLVIHRAIQMSTIQQLVEHAKNQAIVFTDVLAFIEQQYQHKPTAFKNGENHNQSTENQGSAKVLYFAQLNGLSKEETLALFAEHYQAVLATPEGTDHQNIRQFMQHGWQGVSFADTVLVKRSTT